MSLSDFLARLTGIFEDLGLDYMIVGSLASTVHGVARSTQGVDIVVALPRNRLADLLVALPPDDYYVSDTAADEAVRRQSQFNVIDMATGWKADLVIQKQRPLPHGRAASVRRCKGGEVAGLAVRRDDRIRPEPQSHPAGEDACAAR